MKTRHVNGNFFWPDQEESQRINIVNPKDFVVPEIINEIMAHKWLPNSFGLINPHEIQLRNELSRLILHNPEIQEKISNWQEISEKLKQLPDNENDFLAIYEKEVNPFWSLIKSIVQKFDQPNTPRRLKGFVEKLKAISYLEVKEKEMAARISEKLKNVTVMEGIMEIRPFGDRRESEEQFVIGKKNYSAAWSAGYMVDPPKWSQNFFCHITGLRFLAKSIITAAVKARANRSAAILDFPNSLHKDLYYGIRGLIESLNETKPIDPNISPAGQRKIKKEAGIKRSIYESLKYRRDLILTLRFVYDGRGLVIKVINPRIEAEPQEFNFNHSDFAGYTAKEKKKAEQTEKFIADKMKASLEMTGALEIYGQLEKHLNLFSRYFTLPSRQTDAEFKWFALSNLYSLEENLETFLQLKKQRIFLNGSLTALNNLNKVIQSFEEKATKFSIPLCIPEVRDDGKIGISFNGLAPINMMKQNKEMIPFTLPIINGQMICLTGRHGGGKSVAGKSVIENIYLAQSGLPVFAERLSLDIKTVLGAVTNDDGDGSTATVFVNKVKNLFSEIQKVPKEQSLIFIDEIGKGTQETAGYNLGLNILAALKGKQYSVIFNTQIMDLANYAQNNLGALCLKVDKHHNFTEGIGDGQMEQLIKESGLDKFFKN